MTLGHLPSIMTTTPIFLEDQKRALKEKRSDLSEKLKKWNAILAENQENEEAKAKAQQNTKSEDAPSQATQTGVGGAAPFNPANVVDIEHQRAAVIESQDIISTFFKTRSFSKQKENEYRAVLVEFIKHQSSQPIKAAA